MSEWNDKIIEEFRANAGMVGGPFEGTPLILLTTTGARTGAARTNPVACRRDGDRILVFASNAGAPRHPDWYHNLLANPTVTVEVGDGTAIETFIATARPLSGEERDRIYARQAEVAPVFADYQKKASRVIPVVALYRRDPKRARALGDELVRIHDGMRAEMAALLAAIEDAAGNAVEDAAGNAAEDGAATGIPVNLPGRDLEEALRERCLSFCTAFHEHHINESERGFPLLERAYPGLAPALDRLREEHVRLAEIREDLRAAVGEAGSGDPAALKDRFARLSAELEAHFAREEEQLLAALNAL
ncbi:nitroreductase/quinone reductase family protein [Microbispora hainanensis]|uniref:Nitroreductase/quinone reductase family protein n=1 Tax=Microbispora hainanensis TaxID=568844 RepID=A0ABZ1SPI1_9ACTN|nr:nitroreductase/quinone reductase family protein [Microbispora hainanensis]